MNRFWAFAPIVLLVLVVAIAAFVLVRGSPCETVSSGEANRMAPAYSLERLGGGAPVTNADLAGRAHLINVFASWCTPCRAEHPVLMALQQDGVAIVGIDYKDTPASAERFLDQLGDPFTAVALDPQGRFGLELGMAGVPETFVIGPDGAIRAVHRGPLTPEVVEETILPALNEPTRSN